MACRAAILAALASVGCSPALPPAMTGWVEADLVHVAAPAAGRIEALHVARGERVAAQAPLFALDADAEQLARLQAEAQAAQAQAQALNLKSGRRAPEVAAVAQQLAQARAAQAASQAALDRNQALVAQGFLSATRLDDLRASAARDAARVKELQAQLQVVQLGARPQEIAAADAALRAAQAQRDLAQWREGQRAAQAPVPGQVVDVFYQRGERVAANAPVVALLPDGALKLRFFAPEPLLAQLAIGGTVRLSCDGCPPDLGARIVFVSPRAEFTPPVIYGNDTRSKLVFMVEARLPDDAPSALKPGQPVDVRLPAAGPAEPRR
ncbi:HlyD family secretion protein [Piscinibacter sakaiensis]|uniref:HlyD family secretion protein n=1 Tax=Piscinibacter sakaiensis TaxID=1547922 RepID=A0A0K8P0U7_PISS1|nr:HlyD family efflux transporter periplasmic adaptor subunit [Piscinibacter sakaiensis]GAP36149.1 HlyD family secretion protein [Piscinibacter sakaiensis]